MSRSGWELFFHGKAGRDGEDDDRQDEDRHPQDGGVLKEILVNADD
jgi:hypothetical protein